MSDLILSNFWNCQVKSGFPIAKFKDCLSIDFHWHHMVIVAVSVNVYVLGSVLSSIRCKCHPSNICHRGSLDGMISVQVEDLKERSESSCNTLCQT